MRWGFPALLSIAACAGAANAPDAGTADAVTADAQPAVDAKVTGEVDAGITSLRMATVNLQCLLDNWDQRAPLIVAELAAIAPDVIAFQEVCRTDAGQDSFSDLLSRLNEATGKTYQGTRAETHLAWDQYHEGLALVSHRTMSDVQTLDLPVGLFPRKAVIARIDNSLQVAVTHLSFGDQAGIRQEQMTSLLATMQARRQGGEPLIIAGDLNESPKGAVLAKTAGAGYRDTWTVLHPNESGATFPSSNPSSRIDYLLLLAPNDGLQPLEAQRFLLSPTNEQYPSDHVALWVELGLLQ